MTMAAFVCACGEDGGNDPECGNTVLKSVSPRAVLTFLRFVNVSRIQLASAITCVAPRFCRGGGKLKVTCDM